MKNWRSYRSKTSQENKNSSIANDEVALLAERLEFFVPKLMEIMKPWQWLLSIFFWSLFLAIVDRYSVTNETQFVIKIIARFIQTALTLLSSFYLIDYLRPVFKRMRTLRVSLYILLIITINAVVTLTLVLLLMMNTGAFTFTLYAFTSTIVFNTLIIAGFTIAGLLIFLRRYREMTALKQSF
ncbi:MAG TPA: histidine kinase, partial [Psychrobacter sp.]|nr:histidine kinase [Psychrobacter sp.]